MSRSRNRRVLILLSLGVAFTLSLWPLPPMFALYRPNWLALVLCYWVLEEPGHIGMGLAFLLGLVADLVFGTLIGEQALRLCILVFILLRFRPRLRYFTLLQQTLAIAALLLNDRVVVVMVRGLGGEGLPPADFWVAPFVAALLWPGLKLLLDDVRSRWRRGAR